MRPSGLTAYHIGLDGRLLFFQKENITPISTR